GMEPPPLVLPVLPGWPVAVSGLELYEGRTTDPFEHENIRNTIGNKNANQGVPEGRVKVSVFIFY
ncbi:MAG: hypothetical protein JST19_13290, partial [Bacteroidetes bacterium]|nr:hypothetical protein [Bacteroidota bacterium]